MKPEQTSPIPVTVDGTAYFTAADVARTVSVSRQTLWRWRAAGLVPAGRRFRNGQVLFDPAEIEVVRAYATQLTPLSDR